MLQPEEKDFYQIGYNIDNQFGKLCFVFSPIMLQPLLKTLTAINREERAMIQSRIREIRKSKKMTLQQVAERTGTTAQTIGRLETGMRTLSLGWVQRIAEALDTDAADLLAMPNQGDIEVGSAVGKNGKVRGKSAETVALRLLAASPVALGIADNLGLYRKGDIVICNRMDEVNIERADERDCLVETNEGAMLFGRLIGRNRNAILVVPPEPGGETTALKKSGITALSPATALIRRL